MYTNWREVNTGDGGDFVFSDNDLQIDKGMDTAIYMQLFGDNGNGWWGNGLFDNDITVSSETQKTLTSSTTDNSGFASIKIAVENDLKALEELGSFVVDVTSDGYNRIIITINVVNSGKIQYIWDATENQLLNDN
jgi:phage gp46-like protein